MAGTVIGRTIVIDGELAGDEALVVHGTIKGKIEVRQRVEVAADGVVEAVIAAPQVTVHGTVVGDIFASERADLRPESQVIGNIRAPRVLIADGAAFKGSVDMGG
ncbi:MAG: polymer-forming cytoskeletal protein [Nannocystis sp.]|jgi:cytoskeletal protein CcmA (bactofilin family)|nr:polymer-forming cytoskeletal protein [Nannocystis sp.]